MNDKDKLLDHNYDGIQEYDNDLPRWWVQLFWVTAVWGLVYIFYFHGMLAPTKERLAEDMAALKQEAPTQTVATPSEDELIKLVGSSEALAVGQQVFTTRCVPCHGPQGQGVIGPNLTDKYWIHGGRITDIRNVISEGVPAKGMLTWKTMLSAEEINDVTAYIWTLRGTNPANPKPAEGTLFDN